MEIVYVEFDSWFEKKKGKNIILLWRKKSSFEDIEW